MKLNRILVTGSSGFIGKRLKEKLTNSSFEVVELNSENGGVTNLEEIKKIDLKKIEHIFHLAGKTFVPDSWEKPEEFYNINSMGTLNILKICREFNINLTFVSAYIYGEPECLPISENHILKPNNPYAHSKFIAEQFCEFYAKEFNVNINVIRPFNVYGIGQNKNFLIPHIIDQAINNDIIKVKDLTPKRDYIFLDDLIDSLLLTIYNNKGYSVYNIGSGYSISVKQIIETIQQILNINKQVISENISRKNEVLDVIANISKANYELNWIPKVSFFEGIRTIIDKYEK